MTPLCLLVMREVPIISAVCVEVMFPKSSVDATVDKLPTPSLPKHEGNPEYSAIKEIQKLLNEKSASE